MPRFFLKTVSILTLAALTACSGPLDRSDSSIENLHSAPDSALPATAVAEENLSLTENTERYQDQPDQPVKSVAQEPVSTFSIDVDTGSYANVRRFLTSGKQPPKDAVRIEEIVNYFPYNYPLPTDGRPFAVHTETIDSPWQSVSKHKTRQRKTCRLPILCSSWTYPAAWMKKINFRWFKKRCGS